MSPALPLDCDHAPHAFRARLGRRDGARAIGQRRASRQPGRAAAALAVAIALPAFAAPQGWNGDWKAEPAPPPMMAYEIAGESFPGSAFYYLEEAPQPVPSSQDPEAQAHWDDEESGKPASLPVGPAARPMVAMAGPGDHSRALECMTMAIYYEAASESDAGQRAVAQVVMNRVAHPSYPNSVCGVVFQGSARTTGCQFSFTCDGALARKPQAAAWARARSVARSALDGSVYAPVGLATHYHTIAVHPYWADSLTSVGTIGAHIFYRWKGAAGQPKAFSARYAGSEPGAATLAADRARSADAADPVMLARNFEENLLASMQTQGRAANQGRSLPAPVYAAPVQARGGDALYQAENLPGSGAVRPEYAQSGQWLAPHR